MKKALGIIFFFLLFFSNARAETCGFTWSVRDNPGISPPYYVLFDFKNDTSDVAKISGAKLYTQSNKLVYERVFKKRGSDGKILEPIYVKPNSEYRTAFGHGADWPWDIIKKASIQCVAITYDQYENELLGKLNKKENLNSKTTVISRNMWDRKFSGSIWPPALLAAIFISVVAGFALNPKKDKSKTASKKQFSNLNENQKKGTNIIEIVWAGKETMSKTFWLYCILVVVIVSFLSGLAVVSLGNIIFIIPAIVIIWSNTGLWRSSNIYQNQRLQSKEPYGWATAAKVYVILNYLTTLSQLGFILRGF